METIKIRYTKKIPKLAYIGGSMQSNWIDLYCAEDVIVTAGDYVQIPLGIAMQLPEGYEAIVAPRSSTFKNFGIIMSNSIGVIDESYCGNDDEWKFPAYATKHAHIPEGTRIAQFRIIKHQPEIVFETVESLSGANRGGIGSTGV